MVKEVKKVKKVKRELTYEEYMEYQNGWDDKGEWVVRVPEGMVLVMTSTGRYFLVDKMTEDVFK